MLPLRRPTYAEIASTLALVLALGAGGAYAADLVTTKEIARNAVTSPKIKNSTIRPADLSPLLRNTVKAPGPTGPRGASAWDVIPSGRTVTGRIYDSGAEAAPNVLVVETVNLPGIAPAALSSTAVNFAPDSSPLTTDDDAACTGTYANPTAPRGRVCVYIGSIGGVTNANLQTFDEVAHRRHVFYLIGTSGSTGAAWWYWASWAYTAP